MFFASLATLRGGNLELPGNVPLPRNIQVLQWTGVAAIIPAGLDLEELTLSW